MYLSFKIKTFCIESKIQKTVKKQDLLFLIKAKLFKNSRHIVIIFVVFILSFSFKNKKQ